jgi:hypothetical protein
MVEHGFISRTNQQKDGELQTNAVRHEGCKAGILVLLLIRLIASTLFSLEICPRAAF